MEDLEVLGLVLISLGVALRQVVDCSVMTLAKAWLGDVLRQEEVEEEVEVADFYLLVLA